MSYDPSRLHVVGGGDEDKQWWRTKMISLSLSLSLSLFLLSGLFLPFRLMNDEKIFFFRITTEKFGFFFMTTTGFPLQVSFAHQLEKSNLGAIKV